MPTGEMPGRSDYDDLLKKQEPLRAELERQEGLKEANLQNLKDELAKGDKADSTVIAELRAALNIGEDSRGQIERKLRTNTREAIDLPEHNEPMWPVPTEADKLIARGDSELGLDDDDGEEGKED
jgi:hypothetical protein